MAWDIEQRGGGNVHRQELQAVMERRDGERRRGRHARLGQTKRQDDFVNADVRRREWHTHTGVQQRDREHEVRERLRESHGGAEDLQREELREPRPQAEPEAREQPPRVAQRREISTSISAPWP